MFTARRHELHYCVLSVQRRDIGGAQDDTGTGFSPSTSVFLVSVIPPMFHTLLPLSTTLFERQADVAWNLRTKKRSFGNCVALDRKAPSPCVLAVVLSRGSP